MCQVQAYQTISARNMKLTPMRKLSYQPVRGRPARLNKTASTEMTTLIGPVKDIYELVRPPLPLVETTSWSFPSGHSVAGATIAVAAVIVLVRAGPKRRNLEMFEAAFTVVMALSRLYLRAHWLADVAAGVALGAAIATLCAAIMHRIDDRRREIGPAVADEAW